MENKEYLNEQKYQAAEKSITLGAYYCNPEEINDDG